MGIENRNIAAFCRIITRISGCARQNLDFAQVGGEKAEYITGQCYLVNGGAYLH